MTGALKMALSHSGTSLHDLYLRASSNFKGRILTIVSDCS